jgi:hypothetical protein
VQVPVSAPRITGLRPLVAVLAVATAAARPATVGAQTAERDATIRVVEVRSRSGESVGRQVVLDLRHREIRALQTALRGAGYLGVGWTGRLDGGTMDVLLRFQEDRGLVPCGCVSYETIVALGLRPEVVATIPTPAAFPSDGSGRVEAALVYPVAVPILRRFPRPCGESERERRCPDGGHEESGIDGRPGAPPSAAEFPPVPASPGVRVLPTDPRIRH